MDFFYKVLASSWDMLQQASIYILFGLLVGGLLKMFLSPAYVASHLGQGRFRSVFKAALLGIPIPLCSCGVLPAASALKKQGANNGATTAFLISTPESGVDSIAITWALLDPIMTVARPVSAFISALTAGCAENFFNPPDKNTQITSDTSCPIDNCCDGTDCAPNDHRHHHSIPEKLYTGIKYAVTDLWGDLAAWFFLGIVLAGLISILVPDELIAGYLGGGLKSMLLALALGIPLYICATASTPIAAAFIMKGVSPGTALVFLLVGPATNITSLSVLTGILGKRATGIYLLSISVVSIICGLTVDAIYLASGVSAIATAGQAAEVMPLWLMTSATLLLLAISIRPLFLMVSGWVSNGRGCGCNSTSCTDTNTQKHITDHQSRHETSCGCEGHCHPVNPVQIKTKPEPDKKGQ